MYWPSIGVPWQSYPTITSRLVAGHSERAGSAPEAPGNTREAQACGRGMVDLSDASGLPLWLDPQQEALVLAQPLLGLRADPQPRRLLRQVLLDPDAPGPEIPYYKYREVALATDEGVFHEHGVRHDLLLLRAGRVGREFIKTWGHTASCTEAAQCPEVYGVLHGHALLLAQQPAEEPTATDGAIRLCDVRWIEAHPGQKVVVPADYGVVIVNLGSEPLALSCLVAAEAWPVHLTYERMHGAAYSVVARDGTPAAEANPHYAQPLPPLHEEAPLQAPDVGVVEEMPLYSAFVHHPERFAWLREGAPVLHRAC